MVTIPRPKACCWALRSRMTLAVLTDIGSPLQTNVHLGVQVLASFLSWRGPLRVKWMFFVNTLYSECTSGSRGPALIQSIPLSSDLVINENTFWGFERCLWRLHMTSIFSSDLYQLRPIPLPPGL